MWENIRKQYKSNKLKAIASTWNDEFELSNGSYSVWYFQDYIKYIIKKHETLSRIPPIRVYINRANNRLVFQMKDGYKLELQTHETWNYLAAQKKLISKTKNEENEPILEVVEVVWVQSNLVDDQYQQKS